MSENRLSPWSRLQHHLKKRLIAGLAVLVPIGFTFLVLRFLFRATSGLLVPVIMPLAPRLPAMAVAAASLAILVLLVYFTGLLTTYLIGRRMIALGESILERIPLIRTIHGASKQVVKTLSLPNRKAFKGVVWVEFPRAGFLALGFVTGTIRDAEGREFYKLFIPTTPNPTTGFFEVVPRGEVRETSIPIDDAMKMIMSGGILSPGRLDGASASDPTTNRYAGGQ